MRKSAATGFSALLTPCASSNGVIATSTGEMMRDSEADARRSVSCCEYSSYEIDWLDSRHLIPADWDQARILRRLSSAFLSCPSSGRW